MIEAVIFDFDGVIADSMNVGFSVTNSVLSNFGRPPVTFEEYREEFGADWRKFYRGRGLTEQMIDEEPEIFRKEWDMLREEIKAFDGINDAIHGLKGYKLGIVSNNMWEFIVDFLQKFGIHDHFDSIVGYISGYAKPDTRPLMMCLDDLKVKPENVCLIGDTDEDIILARRAGSKIVAVSYGYHKLHKLADADVIVHSPAEIVDAVRGLAE